MSIADEAVSLRGKTLRGDLVGSVAHDPVMDSTFEFIRAG